MFAGRFNKRGTGPVRGFAPAVNAGIGFDLKQGPVVFDSFDKECLGVCYGSSTFSVGSGEVEVTCREVEHGNEVID
jgi:hypothetical protein